MSSGKLRSWFTSPISAVMEAYRAADYELALQRCEALRSESASYCFFRGGFLLQLGRFSEAESSLRRGLPLEESPRARALVYSQLATVMLDQGKFSEAIKIFEDSVRACPDRGSAYRGMAEVRLRQGSELKDALYRAHEAVRMERAEPNSVVRSVNLSEALGVLAWAEATHGGTMAEVERILNEAFSLHDDTHIPMLAKLHYHAARAQALLQATAVASTHLQDASRLDPQGTFGRLARIQLAL